MDNEYGTAVVDETVAVTDAVAEAEDSTSEVSQYESPEDKAARLEAELAKFKEAEKRREAGKKGAENSLKKERDEALALVKASNERIAALEQRAANQDRAAQQQQQTATVEQHLVQRRKELEYRGLDEDTVTETLANERKAMEAQSRAEIAEREKARVEWTDSRKALVRDLVDAEIADAAEDGFILTGDHNAVVAALKRNVFDPAALTEVHTAVKAYIKELKKQSRAEREQAGRAANVAARKAESPEAMADGGTGARSARQVWQAWADGDPNTTRQDAEKARAALKRQGALR